MLTKAKKQNLSNIGSVLPWDHLQFSFVFKFQDDETEESYFSLESAQLNSNPKNCTNLNNIFKVEIYSYPLNVYFRTNKKNQESNNQFWLLLGS